MIHIIGGLRSRFAGNVPKITTEDRLQRSSTLSISIFYFIGEIDFASNLVAKAPLSGQFDMCELPTDTTIDAIRAAQ